MRKVIRACAAASLALAALLPLAQAQSDKPQTPTTLQDGKVIDVAAAKQMLSAKDVFWFDMRSPVNYGKGHLTGAKSLPYREASEFKADFDPSKDQFDLAALPKDKAAKIVFYSDGPNGWKSYKAAVLAIKGGYTNVHYFRGGTGDWAKAGMTLEK